jgi:hypothetical protein
MARESYLVLFCVPEPALAVVQALAQQRPIAKINACSFVIGLKATSEYTIIVKRFRQGLPLTTSSTFCLMETDLDVPTVFPDGGADTPQAEKVIEGNW